MSYDNFHNFYEGLVIEEIKKTLGQPRKNNQEYFADIACVALNHLPPRYVCHAIDMLFYLSPVESKEIEDKVSNAVKNAIIFIDRKRNNNIEHLNLKK